jgi:hypothetical protein
MILLGAFDALVRLPVFATVRAQPVAAVERRDRQWWRNFAFSTAIPAVLFFPAFIAAFVLLPASTWLPQAVTTQVTLWALIVAGIGVLLARLVRPIAAPRQSDWLRSIILAASTVAIGYAALWIVDVLFQTDARFWIVAVKLPSFRQLAIAAIYVLPLTFAFILTAKSLCNATVLRDRPLTSYIVAISSLTGGLATMLVIIYSLLFVTGSLITAFDPLSTIIALQFVPALTAVAIIVVFTWRRTNSYRPAGLLTGLLVTLYVVAGTATQI